MADERYEMGGLSFVVRPAKGAPGEGDQPLGLDAPRDGVLYLPETAEPGAPLLIFLHSAMGAGHAHLRAALAAVDRYGVILVAPDSRGPTWDLIAEGRFGPDVACLDRVLDALADRVDAGTERLAIGGVSDGASYALSIGLNNGDVFPTVPAYSPGFLVVPDCSHSSTTHPEARRQRRRHQDGGRVRGAGRRRRGPPRPVLCRLGPPPDVYRGGPPGRATSIQTRR
jgi:poly(3-hydroxybutyrate) depolymerase